MNHPIRILLVDDSPHFLDAARDFLLLNKTLEVAGAAADGQAGLAQALELKPDVILLDLNLGGQSGLDLIPLFKKQMPKTKVVILTIMQEEPYRAAVLERGADAFVHKRNITQTLVPTIVELMNRPDDKPAGKESKS